MKSLKHTPVFKFLICLFVSLSFCLFVYFSFSLAQDYHLSQPDAAPLYLNPALTSVRGFEERFAGVYRSQWGKVLSNPYVTSHLSYDMPYDRYGMGGYLMHNKAGSGGMSTTSIILSGGYEITTDPKLFNHLYVGLQLGLVNKNFNPANFTWENQYSVEGEGGFNPNTDPGEVFNKTSLWLPQGNLGVYYLNDNGLRGFHYFGGFALFNAFGPKETFASIENHLPRRWLLHGGVKYFINPEISIMPNLVAMTQGKSKEIKFDLLGFYKLDSEKEIIFGPSYRNKDAAVIHLGMKYKEYTCRISYDINTSALKTYSKSQGGVELSFIYQKPMVERKPSLE